MLIDIDIKIADNKGKLIQHFAKRFDEKLNISDKIEKTNGIKKEFEEFLAEYLSASGRTVREKLIYQPYMQTPIQDYAKPEEGINQFEEAAYDAANSEMEYKIHIGKGQIITGKIPFGRLSRLSRVAEAMEKENDKTSDLSAYNSREVYSGYEDLYTNKTFLMNQKYYNLELERKAADIERNLKNIMLQAVEKYEANFSISEVSEENPNQSFDDNDDRVT